MKLPARLSGMPIFTPPDVLIQLHLPKTGGTTLSSMIKHAFPKHQRSVNGDGESYDGLSLLTVKRLPRHIRYFSGHFPFGVHELAEGSVKYITILRHPVARVVSIFHFISQFDSRFIRDGRVISFEEFVEGGDINLDNYQVRVLSGAPMLAAAAPPLGSEVIPEVKVEKHHLDQAKRNIEEHFLAAAPLDCLTDLGLMLRIIYGWPMRCLFNERKNETKVKAKITPRLVRLIEDCNPYDLELYEWAAQRFARCRLYFEPKLSRDRWRFNAVNGTLTTVGRVLPVGLRKRVAELVLYG